MTQQRARAEKMMRIALEEAKKAYTRGDVPVGAVIARGDEIIATAYNERETSFDPTAHAEILALRRAASLLRTRRLDGCTLYVTLEPCPMCAGAIVLARPDAVVYGAADSAAGCTGSVYAITEDPVFSVRIPAYGGVCETECSQLISDFFAAQRSENE